MNIGHIESFLSFLEHEKRYSSHTILSYSNDVRQFHDFLSEIYDSPELDALTHQHLRSWMVRLHESGNSARTINRKISSIRSFFNFMKREGYLSRNPAVKIITPKIGK
ncbi:MAG: site-specific integrase, partial [Saprospiraceae bacterium]|nr:site-specific integrase [Saprospiraceae bacterium]